MKRMILVNAALILGMVLAILLDSCFFSPSRGYGRISEPPTEIVRNV